MPLLALLDYLGTIVFAVTGCLVAARKGVDIIGFIWLGTVTAIGGGTVRDVILGRSVFWVNEPFYLILCVGSAIVLFFVAHWIHRHVRLVLWFDAVGLAVFAVIGTQISVIAGAAPVVCVLMGVLTATLGGVFRDLLAGEATLVMRREIYVTAAVVASVTFLILLEGGAGNDVATLAGIAAGFSLRALSLRYRLKLPGYRWLKSGAAAANKPARRTGDR
jgi:uncharacterized membrane protein YeiH